LEPPLSHPLRRTADELLRLARLSHAGRPTGDRHAMDFAQDLFRRLDAPGRLGAFVRPLRAMAGALLPDRDSASLDEPVAARGGLWPHYVHPRAVPARGELPDARHRSRAGPPGGGLLAVEKVRSADETFANSAVLRQRGGTNEGFHPPPLALGSPA